MKLGVKLACLCGQRRPVLLAAGFFDGVHRGHQAIIRKMVSAARRQRGVAWVMTFDTHPLKILHPEAAPRLLTSTPHKLRLLAALGVHGCVVIHFTRTLARQEPEDFVALLERAAPTLRQIVIGRNWTFGRHGRGTPAMRKALAPVHGFKVTVIPPVRWHGTVISSTRIRAAVLAGRLAEAAGMLGRPFSLLGTVISGRGLGRKLGIPTANLDPHNEVAPPDGVYIVRARWHSADYPGIVNLGVRPTVTRLRPGKQAAWGARSDERVLTSDLCRPSSVVCPPLSCLPLDARRSMLHALHPSSVLELHLFGLRRNLYGKAVEVTFLKKLRRERVFPSLEALQRQIRKDIERAKSWFRRKA